MDNRYRFHEIIQAAEKGEDLSQFKPKNAPEAVLLADLLTIANGGGEPVTVDGKTKLVPATEIDLTGDKMYYVSTALLFGVFSQEPELLLSYLDSLNMEIDKPKTLLLGEMLDMSAIGGGKQYLMLVVDKVDNDQYNISYCTLLDNQGVLTSNEALFYPLMGVERNNGNPTTTHVIDNTDLNGIYQTIIKGISLIIYKMKYNSVNVGESTYDIDYIDYSYLVGGQYPAYMVFATQEIVAKVTTTGGSGSTGGNATGVVPVRGVLSTQITHIGDYTEEQSHEYGAAAIRQAIQKIVDDGYKVFINKPVISGGIITGWDKEYITYATELPVTCIGTDNNRDNYLIGIDINDVYSLQATLQFGLMTELDGIAFWGVEIPTNSMGKTYTSGKIYPDGYTYFLVLTLCGSGMETKDIYGYSTPIPRCYCVAMNELN